MALLGPLLHALGLLWEGRGAMKRRHNAAPGTQDPSFLAPPRRCPLLSKPHVHGS